MRWLVAGALFTACTLAAYGLSTHAYEGRTHAIAHQSAQQGPSEKALRSARGSAPPWPVAGPAVTLPHAEIQVPELAGLDHAVLGATDVRSEQALLRTREALLRALFKSARAAMSHCPGLADIEPTKLRIDADVSASKHTDATVRAVRSVVVEAGAPIPEQAMSCLVRSMRGSVPLAAPVDLPILRADYEGDAIFRFELKQSADCRL